LQELFFGIEEKRFSLAKNLLSFIPLSFLILSFDGATHDVLPII